MKGAILVTVILVGACSRVPRATTLEPTDDGHARRVRFGVSIASFKGDDLIECDDLVASKTVYRDVSPSDLHDAANKLWASMKYPAKDTVSTRIDRSCAEQFPDRPPFALCSDVPLSTWLTGQVGHYSFASVFRSDWAMKECLSTKGHWTSMPRTSPQFLEEEMRFNQADYQRRAKKLLKASGVDPSVAGLD